MKVSKFKKGDIAIVRLDAESDHGFLNGQEVRIFGVSEATGYSAEAVEKIGGDESDGPWFLDDDDLEREHD